MEYYTPTKCLVSYIQIHYMPGTYDVRPLEAPVKNSVMCSWDRILECETNPLQKIKVHLFILLRRTEGGRATVLRPPPF